jgi:hypothetical protein
LIGLWRVRRQGLHGLGQRRKAQLNLAELHAASGKQNQARTPREKAKGADQEELPA